MLLAQAFRRIPPPAFTHDVSQIAPGDNSHRIPLSEKGDAFLDEPLRLGLGGAEIGPFLGHLGATETKNTDLLMPSRRRLPAFRSERLRGQSEGLPREAFTLVRTEFAGEVRELLEDEGHYAAHGSLSGE